MLRRTVINRRVIVDVLQCASQNRRHPTAQKAAEHHRHSGETAYPVLLGEAVGTVALALAPRRIVLRHALAASVSPYIMLMA